MRGSRRQHFVRDAPRLRLARRSVIFIYAAAGFALFAGFGLAGPSKAQETHLWFDKIAHDIE